MTSYVDTMPCFPPFFSTRRNSYTMVCPPVRADNPRFFIRLYEEIIHEL